MLKLIAALTAAAAFTVAPAAHAASDEAFLRADGIQGDAVIGNSKSYIPVTSFSWGAEHKTTISSATGGVETERTAFQELSIDKAVDATSPALFQRMATGTPIKSVELVIRKAGATGPIYLRYHFQTAFVTATEASGGTGEEATTETVKFTFGALSQQYQRVGSTGTLTGEPLFAGWNAMRNLSIPAYPVFGTAAP
jgi:type VI secretion system secreted protein Hcp